jgi:hypothetical protein
MAARDAGTAASAAIGPNSDCAISAGTRCAARSTSKATAAAIAAGLTSCGIGENRGQRNQYKHQQSGPAQWTSQGNHQLVRHGFPNFGCEGATAIAYLALFYWVAGYATSSSGTITAT